MAESDGFADCKDAPVISGEVAKVGMPLRCPAFTPEEPALWFAQLEGQFILSRITSDSTKFYYVATQLETEYAKQVKDIITQPPETNKFEKLKSALINRLSASQEKRIQQLLLHEELGDRRPSQFLRHLQGLAGPSGGSDFVKSVWTSRLPQNIQTVIASQISELQVEKLAEIADRVHEIAPMTPQVASTSSAASTASTDLAAQVSELTRQVAALKSQLSSRGRHRSHSRSSESRRRYDRSSSRLKDPPKNHPHCFYHFNYGARAHKCRSPCNFTAGNCKGSRK
ncbi:uncharacterized protein LOC126912868 [Spodoptera frugiperda]|uniref:Uncharacterized protein LOC118267280 n=1 Tax=Spodoptera frugiperda TaxID=7108 RepID=A0A9R0F725_SPOFR|nr:uncharacterized protein LOC118267280 [Spodoptera frugiperda]XP_050563143.1 uncharacterized protein LOC126912868 [Spodoptera frugiperda]